MCIFCWAYPYFIFLDVIVDGTFLKFQCKIVSSKWKCNQLLYIGLCLSSCCLILTLSEDSKGFLGNPEYLFNTNVLVLFIAVLFCLFVFMAVDFFLRLIAFCEVFCEIDFLRVSWCYRSLVVLFYNQVFPINIKTKLEVWICFWNVSRKVVF